jgi:N-acylneuraminate cytidylyltransferase
LPLHPPEQPWHSSQYQALPEVYVQNASLEIAWTRVVFEERTIAGNVLMPFMTQGHEGFDINDPENLTILEGLIRNGDSPLPIISRLPFDPARSSTT